MADFTLTSIELAVLGEPATLGTLITKSGHHVCQTLELPWHNNETNISCVPAGTYDVVQVNSPKFGSVHALINQNVGVSLNQNGRTYIYIHAGNILADTQGCIITASMVGVESNLPWAYDSRLALASWDKAFNRAKEVNGIKPVTLEIVRSRM